MIVSSDLSDLLLKHPLLLQPLVLDALLFRADFVVGLNDGLEFADILSLSVLELEFSCIVGGKSQLAEVVSPSSVGTFELLVSE